MWYAIENPTSRGQWGEFHCQHKMNTVLTDIGNLISLRDGLVPGLKLVPEYSTAGRYSGLVALGQ